MDSAWEDTKNKVYADRIIKELLLARGIDTPEKARRFLYPSPEDFTPWQDLKNIQAGVDLIKRHIENKSPIVVYGDYDCDGIGAAAILLLTLKDLGAEVDTYIPTRAEDGYGLSLDGLDRVLSKYNPGLIITVDCGISSPDEVEFIKERGIDIIITDHHEPQSRLPDCIVINPKIQDGYPELCGAGVAYKLTEALCGAEYARKYIDICAVSTIADLVPLTGDNRIIASLGLNAMSKNLRPGIKALLVSAGHKFDTPLNSYDIAYKVAPRLNASGRLSTAEKSLKLLTETDSALLNIIAAELELENRTRQELCQKTIAEARELIKDYNLNKHRIIVLYNQDWEGGVIGIAAAKITQDFKRPTVLFAEKGGYLKGSCRSIPGINIHEVLSECKDLLIQFGGHSMAAGLGMYSENLEKFIKKANAYITKTYDDSLFMPENRYDAEISLKELSLYFAGELARFEPYGVDNPKPVFMERVRAAAFERVRNYNHIKYKVNNTSSVIAFNYAGYLEILKSDMEKKLYFTVEKECFNNRYSVKCYLKSTELTEIEPQGEEFIYYAEKYLKREPLPKTGAAFKPHGIYGHLIIAFCRETYQKLAGLYPSYRKHYGLLDGDNPVNAVLFAPDGSVGGYGYYGLIEVYDDPPENYVNFLKSSFPAEIKVHNNRPNFENPVYLTVDDLREAYTHLRAYINGKALNEDGAYEALIKRGYSRSRREFLLAFYILRELDLITFDKDSIIYVKNEKAELYNSHIYRLMVDYAGDTVKAKKHI